MGKLTNGVGCRHPITMRSAFLFVMLMIWVCTLRLQTGAQYSAIEYTMTKTVVQRTATLCVKLVFHAVIQGFGGM